ncbi:MAG: TonB-dependent receptor [Myxococcales bacterium]|nr:TonB-dependent receptor [Myxococcales bacterium]
MRLALLLSWALAPPDEAPPEPPVCDRVWSATILEAGSEEPLGGARLELRTPGKAAIRRVRSDDGGGVEVDGLCPGDLQVTVAKEEHADARVTVSLAETETATTIELRALHARHSRRVIVVGDHSDHPTSPSASESLSGADLARTRGNSLADALASVAGVTTMRGNAGGMGKPIIRGHQGRRTLILVDGVRHEGQDWGIDHAPEVDPQSADRITVIKGAGTTRFGAKAIGGVILAESRPLPQRPSVRSEISSFGFSNPLGGGGSARVEMAPRKVRGLAFRVEGNASRHRAVVTPDYALDNTGTATWNAGAQVGYVSDAVDFGVAYRVMRARGGICTCLRIDTAEDFERGIERGRPIGANLYRADFQLERPRQEFWHHLASAHARIRLGHAGELHALYAFQYNDREEYDLVRDNVQGPQLSFGLATHTLDTRFEHGRVEFSRWAEVGTVGAVFSHQVNDFSSASTLIPDYRQSGWALYDIERLVHERVEFELGARYEGMRRDVALGERDYLSQLAGGRLDAGACMASGAGGECLQLFHTASATLGALVRPLRRVPNLTLRGQLHTSARLPSIDENFMNGAAPSFPILGIGSSTIGVERSWGGESSVQFDSDRLFLEAAGYASYIDNYIYFVPQPQEGQCAPLSCTARGPLPVFAFTPVDAFFGGGELRYILKAPRLPLALTGTATWVRAQDLVADEWLAFIPADRYWNAGRIYLPDTRLSSRAYVEVGGTYVVRQRRYPEGVDFAAPPPAYFLLGAAAGIEFMTEQRAIRLSLVGSNLTNQRYRDYTSLLRYFADEAGWSVQFRLSVDFDVDLEKDDD